jgi:hypothetical protein
VSRDIIRAINETTPDPIKEKNKKFKLRSRPNIDNDGVFKFRSLKKK